MAKSLRIQLLQFKTLLITAAVRKTRSCCKGEPTGDSSHGNAGGSSQGHTQKRSWDAVKVS